MLVFGIIERLPNQPLRAVRRLRGCDDGRAMLLEFLGNLVGGSARAQVAANQEAQTASHLGVFHLEPDFLQRGDEPVILGIGVSDRSTQGKRGEYRNARCGKCSNNG